MKMPRVAAGAPAASGWSGAARAAGPARPAAVVPQGCSWTKKLACGGAFLACGASCALGPEVCVPCLGAVGSTDCLSCLLDW